MPPLHGASPSHANSGVNADRDIDEATVVVDSRPKKASLPLEERDEGDPLGVSNASWASHDGAERLGKAVHSFFYPLRNQHRILEPAVVDNDTTPEQQLDSEWMDSFWKTYDDILFLSLFSQLGILFRLGAANWFNYFDHNVFSNDSPLFVNLPLNCLSCFIVGLLGDGESLLSIIFTRFTPNSLLQNFHSARSSQFQYPEEDDDDEAEEQVVAEETEYRFPERNDDDDDDEEQQKRQRPRFRRPRHTAAELPPGMRQRRRGATGTDHQSPNDLDNEVREVQMLAFGRRIRASKCLILFSGRKEDIDVMEHYCDRGGYSKRKKKNPVTKRHGGHMFDLALQDNSLSSCEYDDSGPGTPRASNKTMFHKDDSERSDASSLQDNSGTPLSSNLKQSEESPKSATSPTDEAEISVSAASPLPKSPVLVEASTGLHEPVENMDDSDNADAPTSESSVSNNPSTESMDDTIRAFSNNVTEHLARMQRVRLVDGWDVKSTPEEMSDDLMLGLRDGFCGAVSSFSSWNSAMVALMRQGQVNKALVGYCIGIQLPIIFYRFGQHVAVFLFMWKCRQETKRDERRGYGIRINQKDDSEEDGEDDDGNDDTGHHSLPLPSTTIASKAKLKSPPKSPRPGTRGREIPSVRAIATALCILSLVTQFTSLSFFTKAEQQLLALSLLFSPLGTLARWRLGKLNSWRRRFPLGTFSCNILACALSGSLGSILAGNPGPRERVFLVSVIAGFGGTLSSVAAFVVEILAGVDPLLLKLDGFYYAVASIFWAAVVGFIFAGSGDWADVTAHV